MKSVFKLDGVSYPKIHVVSLTRSFKVVDGPNTGRLMNFDMVRDVGGTFYNYTLTINTSMTTQSEYDSFYEEISAPKAYHMLEIPYAQKTITFKAYVTSGDDNLIEMLNGKNVWDNLSINFVAISPQRRPT